MRWMIISLILLAGCKVKDDARTEVFLKDGTQQTFEGYYRLINLNKRPTGDPIYGSRAYVEVNDSVAIMIGSHDEGLRSEKEIERFKGKKVRIYGTYYQWCNAWGDGMEATIVMDCIHDVTITEFVE